MFNYIKTAAQKSVLAIATINPQKLGALSLSVLVLSAGTISMTGCVSAASAADLLAAIQPTFTQFLTIEGQAGTPDGEAAIKAFTALESAVASWQSGNDGQIAISAANAFIGVFNTLPIPSEDKAAADIIVAGVEGVVAVIQANSPKTPVAPVAASAKVLTVSQAAKVQAIKPSLLRSYSSQYNSEWNKATKGTKFQPVK